MSTESSVSLKSVPILRDDCDNYLSWSVKVRHLMRAKGIFGLCDVEDPVSKVMCAAEKAAAKEKNESKKWELKQIMGRAQAIYILNQTVSAGHQLNLYNIEDPREAWECLKPAVTHSTTDDLVASIMQVNVASYSSPVLALQAYQYLQNRINAIPGASDLWSEQQTMRLFVSGLKGDKFFSFKASLYEVKRPILSEESPGQGNASMDADDDKKAVSSVPSSVKFRSYYHAILLTRHGAQAALSDRVISHAASLHAGNGYGLDGV